MDNILATLPMTQLTNLPPQYSKGGAEPGKALKAAKDFEACFISHILQQAFSGNQTGLFGGGNTELLFRSIWTQEIAQSMVGSFGIAESVYPILLKTQEN